MWEQDQDQDQDQYYAKHFTLQVMWELKWGKDHIKVTEITTHLKFPSKFTR